MIISISKTRNVVVGLFAAIVICAVNVPSVHAATYYYPAVQTQNTAQVQLLLNQIYSLMAQLQALQNNMKTTYTYTPPTTYIPTYVNYGTYGDYDVDVTTEDVYFTGNGDATLEGRAYLDGAPYASVWFEYGRNGNLTDKSKKITVTSNKSFSIDIDRPSRNSNYYYRAVAEDPSGYRVYGSIESFKSGNSSCCDNDDDIPDVTTYDAEDVEEHSAELHGKVDMNDFDDGRAFFVYGEDEDDVEDVEDEDRYSNIDEDGDNLQKISVATNVDNTRTFWARVYGLDDNTDHYYRACVEYEDEDGDDTLECGDVENFETD